jgi:HEAT repeat protein
MNSYRIFTCLCLFAFVPLLHAQDGNGPKKKAGPPMVDGLKALKHPDAKVRYRAVQTLIDLGSLAKFAVPDLREMLTDKHPQVRVKAAEALWKIDRTPSVVLLPVLLQALKDKDKSVRGAAPPVIALLGSKAKPALAALVEALKDKELDVKLAAVASLGDLGPVAKESAGALLDLTRDADFFLLEPFVGAALANLGDGTIPILTKGLADELSDRRRVSAYALGSMGSKAAPAAADLAKALHHDDPSTRLLAARALGKIGPDAKSTLPKLEKILNDKIAPVRIEAALATWFITGKASHVAVLVKALSDESTSVRENACRGLSVMKSAAKEAVEPVAKLLQDKELRVRAIMTLGEIGPAAAKTLPELKKWMQDKEGDTQLWSAFAVWQISGDAKATMKVLEGLLGAEAHYTPTINVLGAMGPAARSLLPTLVNLYREEDVATDRLALANAIKRIDPAAAKKLGIR